MKTKEVCTRTGLSRKTLRYYEEQGLFSPGKVYRNGREYRDYSDEDLNRLMQIVTLRRARFTVEEILRMKEAPEEIAGIFHAYQLWLKEEQREFEFLRTAAEQLTPENLQNIASLSIALETAVADMKLPKSDIHPHFRYLDALEEQPRHVIPQTDLSEDGACSKAVFSWTSDPYGLYTVLRDDGIRQAEWERENGTVPLKCNRDSLPMKVVKALLTLLTVFFGWKCEYYYLRPPVLRPNMVPYMVIFLGALILRIGLAHMTAYRPEWFRRPAH